MRKPDRPKSSQIFRCAIYTRKSSDDGLEQEFNSLDAQHEACEAYVTSQRHAGWIALPEMYDDGGLSGGTMERPALQRLLSDINAGKVQSRNDRGRHPRGLGYFDRLATRLIGSFSLEVVIRRVDARGRRNASQRAGSSWGGGILRWIEGVVAVIVRLFPHWYRSPCRNGGN